MHTHLQPAARRVLGPLMLTAALQGAAPALALPPGFKVTNIASGWNQPVGLTFAADGHMFVWEKSGRVWIVEDGVKNPQPFLDIHEEVGDWRDFGLLGFCLDPRFEDNGYIYLLYVVDYHHLKYYGTPDYDPSADWYYRDTIARLTRYTATQDHHSVDPDSRKVLVGESMSTGFPMCHQSHGIGTVSFGEDGSLLVGCGDGASYEEVDNGGPRSGSSNTALEDGIIRPKEDIGAFRAQLVDCLNGKIVRIDPATGDGLPDNPFYDPADPRAAKSRVWAMGLRNPFRWTVRPGSGGPDHPGSIYIGDVGWYTWEELNIARGPAANFGWPIYEGMDIFGPYDDASPFNQDAPNPLAGQNGCDPFFRFRDLLIQETLNTPSWPNPCDPDQQVPADLPRFQNDRPSIDWGHGGPSRVKTWTDGDATWGLLGYDGGIPGPQFAGNCAVGGAWYTADAFPPEYKNTYFQADFGGRWIRNIVLDDQDNPVEVRDFSMEGEPGYITALAANPADGNLYLIRFDGNANVAVQQISYGNGEAPIALASAEPEFGPAPLTVQFKGSGSFDPEGGPISFLWDFGDGMRSTEPNPIHQFGQTELATYQGDFTAKVFTLDPPHPIGGGNWDPEVMRDFDFPPPWNQDSWRQYDTYHAGDQGNNDWIGYTFNQPHEFRALFFQEGIHFFDGGWFDNLRVQVKQGNTWKDVSDLSSAPPYPGNNNISFEAFGLNFTPITGTGIRIAGNPGGSANFISVGELHVLATAPAPVTDPTRVDVNLYVTDQDGNTASAPLVISLNNTPPVIHITSPIDGSLYSLNHDTLVDMTADISDAEHGPDALSCAWQVIFHHNDHIHPEPIVHDCATAGLVSPYGCSGETYYYEFALTVTDAAGLQTSRSVFMYPDCSCPADCTADGIADLFDFLCFTNAFNNHDPAADCDHSTGEGVFDLFDFLCFQNRFAQGC